MSKHNADIAAVFEEIADLLEIQGGNPFRIRAYRNAARVVGELAKEEGVLFSISLDAHSVHDSANLRFGIGQARLAGEE